MDQPPHDVDETLPAPDLLALGLGGTNMMSMLWSVASGRTVVGVDVRSCPSLGVHWNIREELYHALGVIDAMMADRYGPEGLPRRGDGSPFLLADSLYHPELPAGPVAADDVTTGFLASQGAEARIAGLVQHTEFIDDRWIGGHPTRTVSVLDPPAPPAGVDPGRAGGAMADVLDGPSLLQARAADVLILLRRYLEAIEECDRAAGRAARVRLFLHHRIAPVPADGDPVGAEAGFVRVADGRLRVRIESIREIDLRGRFHRVRTPGTEVIDLGVPELIVIAQGFDSDDARRLGFVQHDVQVDHGDGRGPVVAQSDYVAGLLDVLVDGRLRRRIASSFDADGTERWVRQIAVGHEGDPAVGWVLVQVPDHVDLDPVAAGLVPAGTDPDGPEYYAGYQQVLREYFLDQAAHVLGIPVAELRGVQTAYGPKLFSIVERAGDDAALAANAVVAGDSFGNGHFMTSGGAMTGMIGHAGRVRAYWADRDAGRERAEALRGLADGIRTDTEGWLAVSAREFSEATPVNFGADRIELIARAGGHDPARRVVDAATTGRRRHRLVPLDESDWRRPVMYPGRRFAFPLPPLPAEHPEAPAAAGRRSA